MPLPNEVSVSHATMPPTDRRHRSSSNNERDCSTTSEGEGSGRISFATQPSVDDSEDLDTSSETVLKLAKQSQLYKHTATEDVCDDTVQCIQRYLRRIYRQVKFFSDSKEEYKEPCFVSEEGRKKQTVTLCEWILENIKRDRVTLEEKIRFWKTYRRQIKSNINQMRQTDMNGFSRKFKKGKLTVFFFIYIACLCSQCFLFV